MVCASAEQEVRHVVASLCVEILPRIQDDASIAVRPKRPSEESTRIVLQEVILLGPGCSLELSIFIEENDL